MSDAQLAMLVSAIITVGGVLGKAIHWAASRIAAALDRNTHAFTEMKERAAEQAEVLRGVAADTAAVSEWCSSHTGVTSLPEGIRPKPKRAQTPARGSTYHLQRPRTVPDDESR